MAQVFLKCFSVRKKSNITPTPIYYWGETAEEVSKKHNIPENDLFLGIKTLRGYTEKKFFVLTHKKCSCCKGYIGNGLWIVTNKEYKGHWFSEKGGWELEDFRESMLLDNEPEGCKCLEIELSRNGIPCMWESGGSYTNIGNAVIIADGRGNPKKPIFVSKSGELACGKHALIPIMNGNLVIRVSRNKDVINFSILRIKNIVAAEKKALLENCNTFSAETINAINAAKNKVNNYHCRIPYYIKEKSVN